MMGRIGHRSLHSLPRRLLDAFRAAFLGGIGKSQRVYLVRFRGQRYKRVVFGDSYQADLVATNIEQLGSGIGLPGLILQHENELWVEFIDGPKPRADNESDHQALVEFFARLYAHAPQIRSLAATPWHGRLENDLEFLHRSTVLDKARYRALCESAERLRPVEVLEGFDYLDPALKNFVISDRGLVAIDLESLQGKQLLGTGIAKATLHWLDTNNESFLNRLIDCGAPDFRPQMGYVTLLLLAGWTKRKLIFGKRHRVDPARFDRFIQ